MIVKHTITTITMIVFFIGCSIIVGGCSRVYHGSSCSCPPNNCLKPKVINLKKSHDSSEINRKISESQISLDKIEDEMIKMVLEISYSIENNLNMQLVEIQLISLQALEKSRKTIKSRIAWWKSVLKTSIP